MRIPKRLKTILPKHKTRLHPDERQAREALAIRNRNETAESDDSGTIEMFQLRERLTSTDRRLLHTTLAHPVDVDTLAPAPTAYSVVWLLHYGLISTWIDARDRVWIRTTARGAMLVSVGSTQRRRERPQRTA
jgi:hypothetical protein